MTAPAFDFNQGDQDESHLQSVPGALDLDAGPHNQEPRDDEQDELETSGDEDDARSEKPASGQKSKTKSSNRPLVRRVATKAVEISEADAITRAVLSAVLGTEDDMVALTTAVMAGSRSSTQSLTDVTGLVEASDPMVAAVTVMTWEDRSRLKGSWAVLAALGVADGSLPASDAKAAVAITQAAGGITDEAKSTLAAVSDLVKRW